MRDAYIAVAVTVSKFAEKVHSVHVEQNHDFSVGQGLYSIVVDQQRDYLWNLKLQKTSSKFCVQITMGFTVFAIITLSELGYISVVTGILFRGTSKTIYFPNTPAWLSKIRYFHGLKQPKRGVENLPPFSVKVIDVSSCILIRKHAFIPWCLIKHRNKFFFC